MPQSLRQALTTGRLDRLAIAVSGLCVAHCFATAMLLGLLASAGGIFESPIFHEVGLGLAILLGAVALGHGAVVHGFMMPAAVGALGLGVMTGALTMDQYAARLRAYELAPPAGRLDFALALCRAAPASANVRRLVAARSQELCSQQPA